MRRVAAILGTALALVAAGCAAGSAHQASEAVPRSPVWRHASLRQEGIDARALTVLDREIRRDFAGVTSLLVARHGRLVFERYYRGVQAADRLAVFSITKSVVSALVGIALADGKLRGVDERLADLVPRAFGRGIDRRARTITVRELLTMTAGFAPSSRYLSEDPVPSFVNRPLFANPGTTFRYDSGSTDLAAAVIDRVTGMSAAAYAERRLFRPLGIRGARWSSLAPGLSDGAAGLRLRPRDLLAFGQLYLDGGTWRGRRVLPRSWVEESTRLHVPLRGGQGYGYYWWTGREPEPYFAALGYPGQMVAVFPRLDEVVVVTSAGESSERAAIADAVVRATRR
jgi:CubicO group peptidase (beta-lactamase class C family)